jgi:hypothetical protein
MRIRVGTWRELEIASGSTGYPASRSCLIGDIAGGQPSGAACIRGELFKLKVSKRTIQKYMRGVRGRNGGGKSCATFLKNHAKRMSACDFLQPHDLLFRQVYAFSMCTWPGVAARDPRRCGVDSKPVVDGAVAAKRHDDGNAPAVLLQDRHDKFGQAFDCAARCVGVSVIRTVVRVPNMNATAEQFVGSARRELLDHCCSSTTCILYLFVAHTGATLPTLTRVDRTKGSANAYRRVGSSSRCFT